jgi:hypothetical protein
MEQFSPFESEALGYYVYVYTDPRNDQPFYIGKGTGNRAFAHLKDSGDSAKVARIAEIRTAGVAPRIEVLAFGLDETTAFKVEAAAIDLIGFENLTNRVVGHGAKKFGRMSIDEVHGKLFSEPVTQFEHPCVLIKINHTYSDTTKLGAIELYDATRGTWKVSLASATKAQYALAVFGGTVREVYEIAEWLPAGSTMYADPERDVGAATRYEFVGRLAPVAVRKLYRWKSVAHMYKPGAANPIMYVVPAE